MIQNIAYYDFATNAPGYGQLQPDDVLKNISEALYGPSGCVAQEKACYTAGNSTESNEICSQADSYCVRSTFTCSYMLTHASASNRQIINVFVPAVGSRDSEDLRQNSSALFPPEYYLNYLSIPEVVSRIGAETAYQECPNAPYVLFTTTGDVCLQFPTIDGYPISCMDNLGCTNVAPRAL